MSHRTVTQVKDRNQIREMLYETVTVSGWTPEE